MRSTPIRRSFFDAFARGYGGVQRTIAAVVVAGTFLYSSPGFRSDVSRLSDHVVCDTGLTLGRLCAAVKSAVKDDGRTEVAKSGEEGALKEIKTTHRVTVKGNESEVVDEITRVRMPNEEGPVRWSDIAPRICVVAGLALLALLSPPVVWVSLALGVVGLIWVGLPVLVVGAWGEWALFAGLVVVTLLSQWLPPRILYLLTRFGHHRLWSLTPALGLDPLPTQKEALGQIIDATHKFPSRMGRIPNTVPLRGEWGTGKSTIVRLYMDWANRQRSLAVVYVDAWCHETEPHPEFALYREIAKDWNLLWPFGWLTVPVIRLVVTGLSFRLGFKMGDMELMLESADKAPPPPVVTWKAPLERLVGAATFRRDRVVIVIDEIDRCSPVPAQRYITLVRRFLAVPGVSVVVPYVDSQLQYKVFHPSQIRLPDLHGSAEGLLWEVFGPCEDERRRESGGSESGPWDDGRLLRLFKMAPPELQKRFMTQLEDKYISDDIVVIKALTAEDFVVVVRNNPQARTVILSALPDAVITGGGHWTDGLPFPGALMTIDNVLREAFAKSRETNPYPIPLRQLYGAMSQLFSIMDRQSLRKSVDRIRDGSELPDYAAALAMVTSMVMAILQFAATRARPADPALKPCSDSEAS